MKQHTYIYANQQTFLTGQAKSVQHLHTEQRTNGQLEYMTTQTELQVPVTVTGAVKTCRTLSMAKKHKNCTYHQTSHH